MAIPTLDSMTELLDETSRDVLGETIQYKPSGGSYAGLGAHVDYGEATERFEAAQIVTQAIRVSLMKADVPAKPGSAVRVQLAKLAGLTFKPVNVASDSAGTHWEFDLETVSS
jgi:hypothetical protein